MLRSLGVLITVLFACAAAVITWPGFFHLEQRLPFTQIVAMRGLMVAAFAVLAVVFLIIAASRRARPFAVSIAVVCVIAAVASGVTLGIRGYGAATLPDKGEESVRVMTWNTLGNATGADSIAQTAVAMEADIISLPETAAGVGEEVAVIMRDLGRPMWVHHEAYN
ncbi:MAG: endonuclease/exonuclease/phosphatase family protein, partial [Microbacterium gubbeenense]